MTVVRGIARTSPLVESAAAGRLGTDRCGGKAAALARLTAAGERVPEWMLLPAEALESHLVAAGVFDQVEHELDTLASTANDGTSPVAPAGRLQQIVDELPLDAALVDALTEIGLTLGEGPFAVRSSAVGEDGDRHSFAGQLDTVLDVEADGDALAAAVRHCWRSAFGARVLDYRRRAGSLGDAARVAVIIQRMIDGDISGVLFTNDPVTGDRERMRVSACAGLGDALVSGAGDADEYVLRRDGAVAEMRLAGSAAVNANAAELASHGAGSSSARLLSREALHGLADLGRRIEQREGAPRDIEWTMRDGELWVLQARPITSAAPARLSAGEHRIVWDNSNIQESYCGVTTPLTFSFARAAYASVYEQTMRMLGVPERTIGAHRPMLQTLLGLLHGRVYYNLNNWYRGLLLLPSFGRNKADMERMMGVEEPVDFVTDERLTVLERLRRVPGLARTFLGLQRAFATLDRDTAVFLETFDARIARIDRASLAGRPLAELMELIARLRRECIEQWVTPIVNDFRVMMAVGRLRRFVERAEPGDAERVMQTLLGGADVAVSAGPALLMLRLSGIARESPAVLATLSALPPDQALAAARGASEAFAAALDELLRVYGDRCMGELKLESRSLHDDPGFVVRMIRNYLGARPADDDELTANAQRVRGDAERAIEERLGAWQRRGFRRALGAARRGIRARESMRLARTRLFGVHRDIYRAIGARLAELGRIERADDVLYLTTGEIEEFWNGTAVSADLAGLVRTRRAEFAAHELENPPNRIVTTGPPHALIEHDVAGPRNGERAVTNTGDRLLRGLGCSAGIAEGVVRVVRNASGDLDIDGHILVAPRTDPGWAPLFPCARGIIVERGSLLSHSAVLARELGLPAVVGIPGIVGMLRDGERVRIDGAAGTIERLDLP